jgi:hypothetical protein
MIDCPVEMVDYESALVQADWYEEQGELETADQIRLMITYPANTRYPFSILMISTSRSRQLRGRDSWVASLSGPGYISSSTARLATRMRSNSLSNRSTLP